MFVIRGTPKLLLAIPAIRYLGLIHDIPGTYTIKAIELQVPPPPLRSRDVLKATQSCLLGLPSWKENTPFDWWCETILHDLPSKSTVTPPREIRERDYSLNSSGCHWASWRTHWIVCPIVVVPKPNGDIRMCVDLRKLHQVVKREHYQMPTVESTFWSIDEGAVCSKLDANSKFQQP